MIFKLTKEQIDEIIELYGGTKQTINTVERKLNLLGVIDNEEDYFEIVCAVIAQKETIKLKSEKANKSEMIAAFMSFDEIIEFELNRKYADLREEKLSTIQKIK